MARGSVYDTEERARKQAAGTRYRLGRFIAQLELGPDAGVTWEQTGTDPHHVTLWGEHDVLLGCVRSVTPA